MENLTGTKVYVSAKHLPIPQVHKGISFVNSVTYKTYPEPSEILYRSATSVHNWAFPVQNSSAVQQNPHATLEEIS
jgi:hypothetical protein